MIFNNQIYIYNIIQSYIIINMYISYVNWYPYFQFVGKFCGKLGVGGSSLTIPNYNGTSWLWIHTSVKGLTNQIMMTSSNGNIFHVTGHLCGPRWIPAQGPVTRSFDVFLDLRLNKRLSKQSSGWWFETLSCSLWRHCNVLEHFENKCHMNVCVSIFRSTLYQHLILLSTDYALIKRHDLTKALQNKP